MTPSNPGPHTPPGEASSDFRRRLGLRGATVAESVQTLRGARRLLSGGSPPRFNSVGVARWIGGKSRRKFVLEKALAVRDTPPFLDRVPSIAAPHPSTSPSVKRALRPAASALTCLVPWDRRCVPSTPPGSRSAPKGRRHSAHPESSAAVSGAYRGGGGA